VRLLSRFLALILLALLAPAAPLRAATPAFPVGLNYPWFQENGEHHYGRTFGDLTDARRAAIESHFTEMQQDGISRLRIWLLADGWRWPERTGGRFQPLPAAFVEDLRWFVRRAHAHGILVQPSLWDFYINRTHREYLTDPAVLPEVIEVVIAPLLRALAGEPGLTSIDVINEPEWILRFDKQGEVSPRGFEPGAPHDFAVIARWVRAHVDAIHAAGLRATVGSASPKWVAHWKGMGLDEYQAHFYPKAIYGWIGNAQFRLLPSVSKLGLDKPCILGEFPCNQKHTDLTTVLGMIRDKGYAGAWAWSYFGDGFPENLAHPFSYRARRQEFRAFTHGTAEPGR
jgi:hypothetical protein